MDNAAITLRAIEAAKHILGHKIVIQSDADFTPRGKRVVRVVEHAMNGRRTARHIRWYVGGKAYRSLELTQVNLQLSESWTESGLGRLGSGDTTPLQSAALKSQINLELST